MSETEKERHLQDGLILNNRYRILRFLSAGGFGNTYEAEDLDEGSHVAIKELFISGTCKRESDDRQVSISVAENRQLFRKQKEKFRKEAARLRAINHPGVVKVSDEFEENGTAYYVMDFVRGKSLDEMQRSGVLDEKRSVQYIKQVLSAIEAVHDAGILHLDIKPSNVMINENNKAIVIDFGASKQLETVDGKSLSLSTGIACTPGYAPIEQMSGKRDLMGFHTDIYAIGATLYKLITGITPPDPSEIAVTGSLPDFKASPEVVAVVKASVQNNFSARPQSIAEFRAILNGSGGETPPNPVPPGPAPKPTPVPIPGGTISIEEQKERERRRRRRMLLVGSLIGVFILAGLLTWLFMNGNIFGGSSDDISSTSADTDQQIDSVLVSEAAVVAPVPEVEVTEPPAVEDVDDGYSAAYAEALNMYNSGRYAECKSRCQALLRQYSDAGQRRQLNQLIDYCDTAIEAETSAEQATAASRLPDKAVDLGLSVLWADRNVGASSPGDYGSYYAWGETSTKNDYSWGTYQYYDGSNWTNIGSNISGSRYDVARQRWGGGWKLPTKSQWEELINRCTWTWTTQGGHSGYKVTGPNGNSIFLPAAGCRDGTSSYGVGSFGDYWSSTLLESSTDYAWYLHFNSGIHGMYGNYRNYGHTVRPVTEK